MIILEKIILKAITNLENKGKLENVRLSKSHRKNSGLALFNVNKKELKDYLLTISNKVYFHGIGAAKKNWYNLNGLWKPIINAGIIEVCKILPYLPGIDKNNFYRAIGIKIGKNTTIAPRAQFDYFHPELIEIGNNCLLGDSVEIWTHEYGIDYFKMGAVKIGDNVRIGSQSVIGLSTEVGNNVKINFCSFLYNIKIPDNSTVIGRPISKYKKNETYH